jgi:adenylate kinase
VPSRPLFLVVLGKQGAGKGTQCARISRYYAVPHIATGDVMRQEIRARTPLGIEVSDYVSRGELVPDDVVAKVVAARLDRDAARENGFVLDGFPRNVVQAQLLEEMLAPNKLTGVINLDVPTTVVLRRLEARRVCQDCQAVYSISSPPKYNWTCDICGGEVTQREDDKEEAILRRLQLYEEETAPLVDYYLSRGLLHTVSGLGSPDQVFHRLVRVIDGLRGAQER